MVPIIAKEGLMAQSQKLLLADRFGAVSRSSSLLKSGYQELAVGNNVEVNQGRQLLSPVTPANYDP